MEDYKHYLNTLTTNIDAFELSLNTLNTKNATTFQKNLADCDNKLKNTRSNIEDCERALQFIRDASQKMTCRADLDTQKERFNRIKVELEFKRNSQGQAALLGGREASAVDARSPMAENFDYGKANQQQVIDRGDYLYGEAIGGMERALGVTEQTKKVAGDIEIELKRQDELMDRVDEKTFDIRSNLKKANKIMNLIYRRYLTDKFIACLIILIMIVIVFLIIYGAVEGGGLNTPKDVLG